MGDAFLVDWLCPLVPSRKKKTAHESHKASAGAITTPSFLLLVSPLFRYQSLSLRLSVCASDSDDHRIPLDARARELPSSVAPAPLPVLLAVHLLFFVAIDGHQWPLRSSPPPHTYHAHIRI